MTLSACDRDNVQVLKVTSLEDSGPGTFRQAIRDADNDRLSIIVFNVAGVIDLVGRLDVSKRCLYIAGQTAPGSGITIRGDLFWRQFSRHIVMRYVRLAGGSNHLIMASNGDFIVDHVSSRWASNSLMTVSKYEYDWSRPIKNVTIQRSLFSEALARHPIANIISAADRWRPSEHLSNIDVHHNLYVSNSHRNPLIQIGKVVNNVVYNWNQGATMATQRAVVDVIANYYKKGPRTHWKNLDWEVSYACNETPPSYAEGEASFYVARNIGPHNSDSGADNWNGDSRMVACYYRTAPGEVIGMPVPSSKMERRHAPLPGPNHGFPIQIEPAVDAYASIVLDGDVGANARVECDGDWVPNSDIVDQRLLREVRTGTGPLLIPESPADAGGWPDINPGVACTNTSGDGVPDAYKRRWGFNVKEWYANVDPDGDGYTVLEAYLNGIRPR